MNRYLHSVVTLALAIGFSNSALAQFGNTTAGGAGQGARASGSTLNTQDVDAAFSGGVQRDGMVGRSASRTFGFSPLSNAMNAQSGAAFGSGFGQGLGRSGFGGGMGFGGMGMGGMGMGGMGMGGFGMGGFGGQNRFGNDQQGKGRRTIRTRLRADFETPLAAPTGPRRTAIVSRVRDLPASPRFAGMQVTLDGRTAVLRGSVANEKDKRMAERLLSLEPGVDEIRNELTVAGADND